MRRSVLVVAGAAAVAATGLTVYWRWFPRAGLGWTNERFNPWLVEHGMAGGRRSEIATLEHFGRKTRTRHLTPVHAVPSYDGFRIVVPLGKRSQWAMNVLAAGHCRLHLHDTVYQLDEPILVEPADIRDVQGPVRWMEHRLGFKYLRLHTFASEPGTLEPLNVAQPTAAASGRPAPAEPITGPAPAGETPPEVSTAPAN